MKNAARASFFSAPPTVVRLDPWRMFNRSKAEEAPEEPKKEHSACVDVVVECDNREHPKHKEVEDENKDTDVSESLEMDSHKSRSPVSSSRGSLEDLAEDVSGRDLPAEEAQEDADLVVEEPSVVKEESEAVKEKSKAVEDNKAEHTQAQAAQSLEQLLLDIDHKSSRDGDSLHLTSSASDVDAAVSVKDEEEEEVFQEKEPESGHPKGEPSKEEPGGDNLETSDTMNSSEPSKDDQGKTPNENTEELVLRSVLEMEDTTRSTSGDDTLQQVLLEVAALSDLSDTELKQNQQFQELDERFVTDRKKPRKNRGSRTSHSGSQSSLTISTPSQSASSSSSSSLDDVVKYNEQLLTSGEANDLQPDKDMMQDYKLTMSLVLDESFSDAEADNSLVWKPLSSIVDELNETLKKEDEESKPEELNKSGASSVYYTPQTSREEGEKEKREEARVSQSVSADSVFVKEKAVPKGRDSQKPRPAARTTSRQPPKKVDSTGRSKKVGKTGQMLPDAPKLKTPVPQTRQKVPAASPRKTASLVSASKTTAPKPAKGSSPRTNRKSTASVSSELSRPRVASSASKSSGKLPSTSSCASTDSSRSSVVRPLPRPGVTKKLTSTASKDSSSSTSVVLGDPTVCERSVPQAGGVKTKIMVDRGALWSDSSTDHQSSDSEFVKKKIPVDVSVCALPQPESPCKPSVVSDIEDIPFADESEVEEKFYTPSTSLKAKPPVDPKQSDGVRKKVLSNVPSKEVELSRGKQLAQDKTKFKSTGGQQKGATVIDSMGAGASLKAGVHLWSDPRDRRSSSYDTPSTPDVVSDSDDNVQHSANATSSASDRESRNFASKDKKRRVREKTKAPKAASAEAKSKVKLRKADDSPEEEKNAKKEKRRSLLDMLLSHKSLEKRKGSKERIAVATHVHSSIGEETPSHSVSVIKQSKKGGKLEESLEGALSSELQGLQISVFDKRGKKAANGVPATLKEYKHTLPVAPKASG